MTDKIKNIYTIYRSEFMKIVWPSRAELIRKTITVSVVSLLFGAYIAALDGILAQIFSSLVGLL